ncbi:MAG: LEA type 2 family protein [Methanoregulaceae archaeon]|nr:LEA type 2 family protein [Methanoregulaceae archaeon]
MQRAFRILLLLLIVSGMLVSGCSSRARMPEVEVAGATITSFSLAELTLDVLLSVDNPNPVGISLESLAFDVYYRDGNEWKYLSHGEQTGIRIEPGKTTITIPVKVKNTDLLGAILSLANANEIPLQIRGVVVPDLPGGLSPEIPFTKTITLSR